MSEHQPGPATQDPSADRPVAAPTDPVSGPVRSSWPARLVSFVVASAVLWWSVTLLDDLIGAGRFPRVYEWTSGWPLVITVALVICLALGVWRRNSAPVLAATVCAAGLFTSIAPELPYFSSNNYVFDGAFLMPLYAVVIVGAMLYLSVGPRRHPDHQRIVLTLLVACAANTKLFVREATGIHGLLLCWVALGVVASPLPTAFWQRVKSDRFAKGLLAVVVALVAWIGLSIVTGDSLAIGVRALQTLLLGVGLCYCLATGFGRDGVARAVGALLVGIAVCLGMAVLGAMDAAATEGWSRVFHTRLRLFQSHPNIIGPYFAGAVVLCGTLLFWRGPQLGGPIVRRLVLLVLLAGSALCLWRTESTAAKLGLAVGLGLAAFVMFGPRIRRPGRLYAGAVLLALAGLGAFLSPVGDGVRASLEARTFEPSSAIGQRYHFWRMAGRTIAHSPLVGVGPSNTYFHARFAEPSYYDDARQTHHAHNLFLHVAEGSGLPALALFIAALIGLIELYRRLSMDRPRSQLALPAALLGVPIGILASNMLDLGQVQPAYLPHYFWIHLGLGAALAFGAKEVDAPAASSEHAPARRWVRSVVVLLLAIPFGANALIGDALITSSRLRAFSTSESNAQAAHERDLAAYRGLVLGRRFFFAHIDAHKFEPQLVETIAQRAANNGIATEFDLRSAKDIALESWERQCREAPGNARVWIDLAHKSLREGRIARAGEALDKAELYDPRGHRMGRTRLLRAWWRMAVGDLDGARDSLFGAALSQGTTWAMVPHDFVPVRSSVVSNARRMLFVVQGPNGKPANLPLDEVLVRLGEHTLDIAEEDPVSARRHLRAINAGFRKQNRFDEALVWFERYREIIEHPIPSVIKLEFELLNELGRRGEANELLDTMRPGDREVLEPDLLTSRLMASDSLQMSVEERALLETFLDPLDTRDIFFEIALHTQKLRTAALIYAEEGKWDEAVRTTRRFLREYIDPNERRITTGTFTTRYLMPRGMPSLALMDLCETILRDHNVRERRFENGSQIIDMIAEHIALYWDPADGDMVAEARGRFWGTGPAGDGLVRRLERIADGEPVR